MTEKIAIGIGIIGLILFVIAIRYAEVFFSSSVAQIHYKRVNGIPCVYAVLDTSISIDCHFSERKR